MSAAIPVSVPDDLLEVIRETASATGLSQQDVIRQSVKLGAPVLRKQLSAQASVVKPFSRDEARRAFASDPAWEKVESAMTSRHHGPPEAD